MQRALSAPAAAPRLQFLRGLLAVVFVLVAGLSFAAPDYPELTGRVVDQAGVIPAPMRATLQTKLKDLEDKSGIQLVVATIRSLGGIRCRDLRQRPLPLLEARRGEEE